MSIQTDTIAAVATPAGPGAIGILRLSGPRAADIAAAVFRPLGKKGLLDRPVRTLVYGDLLDREGQVIDRVLCTYSRGPESYTGEDTAELHCHGSPMVLTLGLEALFAQGARQAGPGEFTQRAFLNGRLDLAQAEAVADLLDAQSREGARHAAGQLSGALSRRVGEIYSALVDLMAHFHAVLLPGRGHRPLHPGTALPGPDPAGDRPGAAAGHLPAGAAAEPRSAVRHRGAAQRGQVLPAQRPGGL